MQKILLGLVVGICIGIAGVVIIEYVTDAPSDAENVTHPNDDSVPHDYDGRGNPYDMPPPSSPPPDTSTSTQPVACTMDAKQCPDGSFVGRVAPNCEFAACPSETDAKPQRVTCTEEMKQADFCTEEYAPVCGLTQVQCVTEPCDPVPQTYSNGCHACAQGNVDSYVPGECRV